MNVVSELFNIPVAGLLIGYGLAVLIRLAAGV
jgi:hypothetical protein